MKFPLLFFLLGITSLPLHAQVNVDTSLSRQDLVDLFMGEGVSVFNVRVHGNLASFGSFETEHCRFPLEKGIVLSTGRVSVIPQQNESPNTSSSMREGRGGDEDLSRMVNRPVYNSTVIEFDFVPLYDSLYFDYVFGSEEYPEYVGSPFNDVFCLLIEGPNFPRPVNLARVGDRGTTVMINSVNHKKNSNYFIPNFSFSPDEQFSHTIEYDGFTTLLTAACRVTRGKVHHLKIAIGNVNDYAYDSGVFLRAGSFGSRGDVNGAMRFSIPFDFDVRVPGTETGQLLDSLAQVLKSNPGWKLAVLGHTDSVGSHEYNLKLSQDRARAVADELIRRGVREQQLFVKGYGYTKPLRSNSEEEGRKRNRRVELMLRIPDNPR